MIKQGNAVHPAVSSDTCGLYPSTSNPTWINININIIAGINFKQVSDNLH